jgi:hypothetical protein
VLNVFRINNSLSQVVYLFLCLCISKEKKEEELREKKNSLEMKKKKEKKEAPICWLFTNDVRLMHDLSK